MANPLYNLLMGNDTTLASTGLMMDNARLEEDQTYLMARVSEVEEDLLRISDAFDRRGTQELTGMDESEAAEIPLKTVKQVARTARAVTAMNPFVKSGVEARISYIWGKGVVFDNVDSIQDKLDSNRRRIFSPQSLTERERVLATDGNLFLAVPTQENETANDALVFRVPLEQIVGCVSNPEDQEDIWYYKREWVTKTISGTTGREKSVKNIKYYPSMHYAQRLEKRGKSLPGRWGTAGVAQDYVIQHEAVNRQVGWRWGLPDVMPVIFWAKAYKEYLEDNATLVKAYSRLAWQVKSPTAAGGVGIASTLMKPPSRDPLTGQANDVGGSGVTGGGVELTPLATNSASIDFTKGAPLASAIAAGLEVSQSVIMRSTSQSSGSYGAETTLDLPTLKAMESRQELHTESFLELFEYWGVDDADVTWPQIFNDTTKDRIAAIGTAIELGILYKEEGRKEVLEILDVPAFKAWDELPDPADDPANQYKEAQAELAFNNAQKLSNDANAAQASVTNGTTKVSQTGATSAVAKQGVSGGVAAKGGAQSTANSARQNRKSDTKNR